MTFREKFITNFIYMQTSVILLTISWRILASASTSELVISLLALLIYGFMLSLIPVAMISYIWTVTQFYKNRSLNEKTKPRKQMRPAV